MIRALKELGDHPCFNEGVKGKVGRIHLPVAPKCNILCNYCNRKYDCVNESRPGVTSAVLTPYQALNYTKRVLENHPYISVVGIAGPGDPFANPHETLETIKFIREEFPNMLICLSTNGLRLPFYIDSLVKFGVTHVTITINAVDPDIGQKIYSWIRDGKIIFRGRKASELLISRQLESIYLLKEKDIIVKVNTIVIPGVNDGHVHEIAKTIRSFGADIMNCMGLIPNKETPFEGIKEPSEEVLISLREELEKIIPQMKHCKRCRADAVGLLDKDKSTELYGEIAMCKRIKSNISALRPYVAVATREGMLVNMHLGEAEYLQIWGKRGDEYYLVEERKTPEPGSGIERWRQLAEILKDCSALLVASVGENPRKVLTEHGINIITMSGFIEMGLRGVYENEDISFLRPMNKKCCGGARLKEGMTCDGSGDSCS